MEYVNQRIGDKPPYRLVGSEKFNCQDWCEAVRTIYWTLNGQVSKY